MAGEPVKPVDQLASVFWQTCGQADKANPVGWSEIGLEAVSSSVHSRFAGHRTIKVFRRDVDHESYLVSATFASPQDGIVKRCGVYSAKWNAYQAYLKVYPMVMREPAFKPPGFFERASIPAFADGFRVDFDSLGTKGFAEVVFFDAATSKRLAADAVRPAS